MAQWKVVADHIQLFPHSSSDRLLVGKIGKFQVVVSKDSGYKDGDVVVFAPERSILPEEIRSEFVNSETGVSYLQGDNQDRVGTRRLRGELSEGATLPLEWVRRTLQANRVVPEDGELPLNWDLSAGLGITKYVPTIPAELVGKVSHMDETAFENRFVRHDVELFHMFKDEFVPGEMVDLTEKVHGSQVNIMRAEDGDLTLTSKALGHEGLVIDYDPDNKYWKAVRNSGLDAFLAAIFLQGSAVQVVAELVPCHKGFTYGFTEPNLRIFRFVFEGRELSSKQLMLNPQLGFLRTHWVPFIATVPFDPDVFAQYANGREQVSGKELHIREGIVITPVTPRKDSEGHGLAIKFLNVKFKGSDNDLS